MDDEKWRPSPVKLCGGCCCCSVFITIIVLISLSISSLEQLDLGLNYDTITLTLEDKVYQKAGMYFLGVGHHFIKYPKTIQTIEFIAEENDRLQTRTSDGLPVSLSVSFQFRYDPSRLMELYLTYKQEELEVYEHTAKAVIANVATNFSAYTFFNDKQGIATEMQLAVADIFSTRLFARIEALQITRVELPGQFQSAILQSIEAKQNITQSQRFLENMEVTFQTQVLVANQTRRQTIALAQGIAAQRRQQAEATARVTEQSVYAEMYAYGNLSQTVSLNTTEQLAYIWWSGQEDIVAKGKEFLVGLDPSAVIRNRGAAS